MKDYLGQTLGLTVLVLLCLTGLSLLPEGLSIDELPLRKMDIFSDIRRTSLTPATTTDTLVTAELDSLSTSSGIPGIRLDSLGLVPLADPAIYGKTIEDYTPAQERLDRFFAAVDAISTERRTVRVAFFGDSFVEGDILLGDLRDTLQTLWGGEGVGYVPITSEVARFKRTLVHRYENWSTFSIVKHHQSGQPFGINGFVYRPQPGASVNYEGADYFRHTRRWSRFRLFYRADSTARFVWQNRSDMPPVTDTLPATNGRVGVWDNQQSSARAFAIRLDEPDSTLILYGASLESGPGFYLDNFSVRGNTGGRLKLIRPEIARQFDAVLQYNLVVVQLGLNAVTPKMDNLVWYRAELDQTFDHLRKCFPNTPILLISVADRAGKVDGELATLPSVRAIAAMQRELAREHGFLFYDLFRGMGGDGSMIEYAERHKPALANRDYTHLTHEGGKLLGYRFADLLLGEQRQYRAKMMQKTEQ